MSNGLLEALEAKIPDMDAVMAIPDSGYGLTLNTLLRDLKGHPDEEWLGPIMLQMTRESRFGYVYIIEGTHEGVTKHKIGKANNLRDRVATFNVKIPFDIRVVASFYVLNAREFEGELHAFMKAKRIAGEWFDLTQDDIRRLCLLGVSREARDLHRVMERVLDSVTKKKMMSDTEYIEYLESLLVIRNIPFSREVKDHGAQVISDREAMG